jgi:hypothetical protein
VADDELWYFSYEDDKDNMNVYVPKKELEKAEKQRDEYKKLLEKVLEFSEEGLLIDEKFANIIINKIEGAEGDIEEWHYTHG